MTDLILLLPRGTKNIKSKLNCKSMNKHKHKQTNKQTTTLTLSMMIMMVSPTPTRRICSSARETLYSCIIILFSCFSVSLLLLLTISGISAAEAASTTPPSSPITISSSLPPSLSSSTLATTSERSRRTIYLLDPVLRLRGGEITDTPDSATDNDVSTTDNQEKDTDDDDEERYSRQVYTLGARAHKLVRSSTVYMDGPLESGLLWECCKNLALSGVGNIVILTKKQKKNEDEVTEEDAYHDATFDDLGRTYIRGARAEISGLDPDDDNDDNAGSGDSNMPLDEVLLEYLTRLNPSLQVSTMEYDEFIKKTTTATTTTTSDSDENDSSNNSVLLCLDRPFSSQLAGNMHCRQLQQQHQQQLSFVSAETAGVYGKVFCDFGLNHEIHDADGETPLVVPLDRIELSSDHEDSNPIFTVRTIDGERHDVSRNDIILFQRSDGSMMEDCLFKVTSVKTPERIEVQLLLEETTERSDSTRQKQTIIEEINERCVTFSRQKQIERISFISLHEATSNVEKGDSTVFTPCDLDKSFDEIRRNALFGSFQTLDVYVKKFGRLPSITSFSEDQKDFVALMDSTDDNNSNHIDNFLRTCRAKFVPIQAIFGAIASQECLKAVSGLYSPIQQFLIYDCDEVLPSTTDEKILTDDDQSLATGMKYIFGPEIIDRLENQKLFVVGAGAIGCEVLKNLSGMNGGTGPSGRLIVTDMDTIEKSNLSRQLLFRDNDIGKFKSKAAEEAVRRLNGRVKLECHTSKVGTTDDPGPFDNKFWSKGIDVILNALDNMEARLFMDGQCVANQKALVDAGTLGSKGNVQVVVPHKSESYGSSVDPPEQAIPVCTLKNFPYTISHTIQWGRDIFDGLFVRRPRQANKYAGLLETGIDSFVEKLHHDLGEDSALETAKELTEDLSFVNHVAGKSKPELVEYSVEWAVSLAKQLYFDAIEALLKEHPIDSVDDDGEPFWSGSRKMPKSISYVSSADEDPQRSAINENLVNFVRSASRLRYETIAGIPANSRANSGLVDEEKALHALQKTGSDSNTNTTVKNENQSQQEANKHSIKGIVSDLESIAGIPNELHVAEFEKDDDANDHVAFITAASNLRAICYGIPPVDSMETRKVAGKIIPAMITTTAFVSAVSCLELVKFVQKDVPLKRHRNAFINLALPFFAFTSPLPAEEFSGWNGSTHTLWDRIEIKEGKKASGKGGITLRKLLSKIQKKVDKQSPETVQVSTISLGPLMIYANFLNEEDDELLDNNIWDIVDEAAISGAEFDQEFSRESNEDDSPKGGSNMIPSSDPLNSPFLDLSVVVEDAETFEEVELPPVRIHRYIRKE